MACMFCRGTGIKLFNVYTNYGNSSNTVRDDMVEFFGLEVECYLKHDDCVCNRCMNMLDNIAKLKRFMWSMVTNPSEYKCRLKMGKVLNHFATMKLDEADFWCEPITPQRTPTPMALTLSGETTPLGFVNTHYVSPYDVYQPDDDDDERGDKRKERSLSRGSSKYQSDVSTNEEIEAIFRRHRKKRGHKWTRIKGTQRRTRSTTLASVRRSRAGRSRQVQSDIGRPYSALSDASFLSYYEMERQKFAKKQQLLYDENGELLNRRTRSVTKLVEEEMEETKEKRFSCNEDDCTEVYCDLDYLTEHKILDHNRLALYFCDECNNKYTTKEHLKIHQKLHDMTPLFCFICGIPLENREKLKDHVDLHIEYSVPCLYCDLSFLNKRLCQEHVRHVHKGRKQRRVFRKELIQERVDNYKERSESSMSVESEADKEYEVRVMILGNGETENNIDETNANGTCEINIQRCQSELSGSANYGDISVNSINNSVNSTDRSLSSMDISVNSTGQSELSDSASHGDISVNSITNSVNCSDRSSSAADRLLNSTDIPVNSIDRHVNSTDRSLTSDKSVDSTKDILDSESNVVLDDSNVDCYFSESVTSPS